MSIWELPLEVPLRRSLSQGLGFPSQTVQNIWFCMKMSTHVRASRRTASPQLDLALPSQVSILVMQKSATQIVCSNLSRDLITKLAKHSYHVFFMPPLPMHDTRCSVCLLVRNSHVQAGCRVSKRFRRWTGLHGIKMQASSECALGLGGIYKQASCFVSRSHSRILMKSGATRRSTCRPLDHRVCIRGGCACRTASRIAQ